MRRITRIVIIILLYAAIPYAQTDTLAWEYVINQPWNVPESLDEINGIHPRLLLTDARIDTLQERIGNSHAFIWEHVYNRAMIHMSEQPSNNTDDETSVRKDGDAIAWLAMAYLLTENTQFRDKAISWMETVCSYDQWDYRSNSLAAGHCLMGVSLGYDWLYNELTPEQRNTIRSRVAYFANILAANPKQKERYLSNHCQVEYAGLAAAGMAFYGETDDAETWLRHAYNIFQEAFQISGGDGTSTEGHQYWGLMTEFQMLYVRMAADLLGADYLQNSDWLKNLGDFILYSSLPTISPESNVMRFGDTKYYNYNTHGPVYQLFNVASAYKQARWQWLAMAMADKDIGMSDRMGWSSLIWYDPDLSAALPQTTPTARHFEDIGWFTSRSSWAEDAVMVGFKCGPFHGHAVQALYDGMSEFHQIVNGHGHPDVNHFNIFAYGKWLVVDDAYPDPKKMTNHNTILVNGYEQLGSNTKYLNRQEIFDAKATSRIIKAETNSAYDYVIGDAENIYPAESGLKSFRRHLLFIKPDVIVILDELQAESPATFDWYLHTAPDGKLQALNETRYQATNDNVVMDISLLWPTGITSSGDDSMLIARPDNALNEVNLVTVMHPRLAGSESAVVDLVDYSDSSVVFDVSVSSFQGRIAMYPKAGSVHVGDLVGSSAAPATPSEYRLGQNRPNPFNARTTILYSIPTAGQIELMLYDLQGRDLGVIERGFRNPGTYEASWYADDFASGLYFYSLRNSTSTLAARKMLLVK